MTKRITGTDAEELLELMQNIDAGYKPTIKEKRELSAITEVDFSSLSLSTLPDCIGQLTALQSLDVSYNSLNALPESIGRLTALQSLDVSYNRLNTLPESIGRLTALRSLDVSANDLNTLPESIGCLTALQILSASRNELSILPESIGCLTALQSLNASDNNLNTLPESIGRLTALQSLYVNDNKLRSLPESIGRLTALQILSVGQNELSTLPEAIGQLSALQRLSIGRNELNTLPEAIGQLSALQGLGLGGNKLSELPDTFVKIVYLQELYMWGNEFIEFPRQIYELEHLQLLDINNNPIQNIPPQTLKSKKLKHLNLSNLKLHQLPAEIMGLELPFKFGLPMLHDSAGIFLENTTLAAQPISLFMQPREFIQAYFDTEQIPVNEGKVIFLGYGDVGKSYSIQRILNNDEKGDYKTNMTPGISISNFSAEKDGRQFNICFWDFGGQEIMHAMHRCFLTHRTCYVVMVSTRQPDLEGQARYWLRNVESFANGSDVLLVVNRWEDYPYNQDLNYSQLKEDFKNLVGCVSVSAKCDDKQTFHQLTKSIIDMASKLDSTGMNFPKQWHDIRQSLTKMAGDGKYYINQDDYYQICDENGLNDANIRMWLLEWFNDLGTCFSYHQDTNKTELKEYKVLNPEWLTNAIYILILNGRKFSKNGVIYRKFVEHLLSNPEGGTLSGVTYTSEECGYILEVMRKFTLSYSVSETEEFIPALCPNETPSDLYPDKYTKHLKYELEYTYLPDSVVHQLMIYCYKYLKLDKCWRKGMLMDISGMGLSAVVSMGGSDTILSIDVYSHNCSPIWLLLQPLLKAIREINNGLNLRAVDYVYPEMAIDGKIFTERYELNRILNIKQGSQMRRPSDILQGRDTDYSISELLANLYGEENLEIAESEVQERNSAELDPSALASVTLNNCTIILGNNNDVDIKQHQGVFEEFLRIILNNQEKTNDAFLSELARIFAEHNDHEVKELGEAMQNAQRERKSIFEVLRNRLDDSEKLVSIAANLYTIWPAIKVAAQKAPALAALFADLFAKITHL